ncbi:MAG: hypothetical protein K9G70_14310, partial [Prolixibacteraceae bacterium]|nr:hypothetical protein [Prolixibacteraceae bacterium]
MHQLTKRVKYIILLLLLFSSCKEDIVDITPIKVESQVTHVSVYNGADGAIDIFVSGGVKPYQYQWSNGVTSQDLDSIAAGEYRLKINDKSGTEHRDTFVVLQPLPDELVIKKEVKHATAYSLSDGSINIHASGGLPPYDYNWSNGEITANLDQLEAGIYILTLTDAIDSTLIDTTVITQPDPQPMQLTLNATNVSSYGQSDGAISSNVSGGLPPYTYQWSNGSTTPDIGQITAGRYRLVVSDQLGTELSDSVTITEPEPDKILLSIERVVHPTETGASDGSINIDVRGGYPPFDFKWSNGEQSKNLGNITAGTYEITVSDTIGQLASETVELVDSVYDYDGNAYSYIKIGEQVWMQQNLRVTHSPDGSEIEAYAYNNNETMVETYGRLYTWDVAMNASDIEGTQGLCPAGWHIPSDEEFKILEMELGMTQEEADRGNTWRGDNVGTALKEGGLSGYNAMLSGRREANGSYRLQGRFEYVWTSTSAFDDNYAWRRCL